MTGLGLEYAALLQSHDTGNPAAQYPYALGLGLAIIVKIVATYGLLTPRTSSPSCVLTMNDCGHCIGNTGAV